MKPLSTWPPVLLFFIRGEAAPILFGRLIDQLSVLTLFDGAMLALFGGFRMASRGDVGNVG